MKTIIIGLPKSGRTTIAKNLAEKCKLHYIHAATWMKASFRTRAANETADDHKLAFQDFYKERLKINPDAVTTNIEESMQALCTIKEADIVVDGIDSPRDFINLFDYNQDVIIFVNRTNGPNYIEGCDHINVNVVRDYCLWLGTMGLLPRANWLEFNFPIPGDAQDSFVKELGNKNTVTIVRSIEKAADLIKENYEARIAGQEVEEAL